MRTFALRLARVLQTKPAMKGVSVDRVGKARGKKRPGVNQRMTALISSIKYSRLFDGFVLLYG